MNCHQNQKYFIYFCSPQTIGKLLTVPCLKTITLKCRIRKNDFRNKRIHQDNYEIPKKKIFVTSKTQFGLFLPIDGNKNYHIRHFL